MVRIGKSRQPFAKKFIQYRPVLAAVSEVSWVRLYDVTMATAQQQLCDVDQQKAIAQCAIEGHAQAEPTDGIGDKAEAEP